MNQGGNYFNLTGYGAFHERTQGDWEGLDALLTSSFVQDWNLMIMMFGCLTELRNNLLTGRGYVVSNGLYQDQVGTAAWIIEGKDHTNRIIGVIHTLGAATNHSAF